MALQLSETVRNAMLDAIETAAGTAARVKIFDGTLPANCAAADNGTVLADITCPSDWMAAASGGSKAISGSWQDTSANASGTADYFRLYASDGTTCHAQGTVGTAATDMIVDNVNFNSGQQFTITAFTLTAANS
jgi:hypothetical protein